jgi:hypothetical protein
MNMNEVCNHGGFGGVYTNFDTYGTRKRLGLPTEPFKNICWKCWREWGDKKADRLTREAGEAARKLGQCGFDIQMIWHCENPIPCIKHAELTCWSCGQPATGQCYNDVGCVVYECNEHPHEGTHD